MQATIHYCRTCGFRAHAEAIAAALRSELGIESELREGFWGTFRIECDGQTVYDRWRTRGWLGRIGLGRTPTPDEIVALFRRTVPLRAAHESSAAVPTPRDGMPVCGQSS
jgi:selT/selW/selH-like putative selenoprotein